MKSVSTTQQLEQFWQWVETENPTWDEADDKAPPNIRNYPYLALSAVADFHDTETWLENVFKDAIFRETAKKVSFIFADLNDAKNAREDLTDG